MDVPAARATRQTSPAPTDVRALGRASSGFTLVEVVIVIVIMAVGAAVVVPNMRAGARQRVIRGALQGFVSAVRGASARAVIDRHRVELKLWPDDGAYELIARAPRADGEQQEQEPERSLLVKVGSDRDGEAQGEPQMETRRFDLPASGSFGDIDGGRAVAEEGTVVFDFYPSGSSSGGQIEFVFDTGRNRRQAYKLEINPLVSSISIEESK